MRVSVFGLGYVGCVTSACLARAGHQVVGVDANREKVEMVAAGRSPIVEPGLAEVLAEMVGVGRLRAVASTEEAVRESELALICVGTPGYANGAARHGRARARGPGDRPRARRARRAVHGGHAQHGLARHGGGRPPPGHPGRRRARGGGLAPPVREPGVHARGLVAARLRPSPVHPGRLPRRPGGRAAARALRGRGRAVRAHRAAHRRDGQVREQCVSRAQGVLCQRGGRPVLGPRRRRAGGDAHLPGRPEAERVRCLPASRVRLRRLLPAKGPSGAAARGPRGRRGAARSCRPSCRATSGRSGAACWRCSRRAGAAWAWWASPSSRARTTCARARW